MLENIIVGVVVVTVVVARIVIAIDDLRGDTEADWKKRERELHLRKGRELVNQQTKEDHNG